jgi:hypothetical protein
MAVPSPGSDRRERRKPGVDALQHRDNQKPVKSKWHRRVDATVAYSPHGAGFVGGLIGVWASPNKLVGTGILVAGTAFDVVSEWWGRRRERREEQDENR